MTALRPMARVASDHCATWPTEAERHPPKWSPAMKTLHHAAVVVATAGAVASVIVGGAWLARRLAQPSPTQSGALRPAALPPDGQQQPPDQPPPAKLAVDPALYAWIDRFDAEDALGNRFLPPAAYARTDDNPGSFAHWLRRLPLRPGRPPVRLHDGSEKANQTAHAAVLDIDAGTRDLQQCADAVIRLRGEYLYATQQTGAIQFRFTSGDAARWTQWTQGQRPRVAGQRVTWEQAAPPDASYRSFRRYLDTVFTYAGSASLERELAGVADLSDVRPGDVYIRGGYPGHAIIVLDAATGPRGDRIVLLAQSYMPAQDIHILANPNDPALSPWYAVGQGEQLVTPEWVFTWSQLRRFQDPS